MELHVNLEQLGGYKSITDFTYGGIHFTGYVTQITDTNLPDTARFICKTR